MKKIISTYMIIGFTVVLVMTLLISNGFSLLGGEVKKNRDYMDTYTNEVFKP